jgi:acetoin utilization protein AcuB
MKSIPTIKAYMTTNPHTIGNDQPLTKAHGLMREFKIRHLPVLEGGQLVGLVSDRDLKFVESFKDVDPSKVKVKDALTDTLYTVGPETLLTDVCREMATHKYGSVLVMDHHKLVGIFTWVDALEAMAELLETRLKG